MLQNFFMMLGHNIFARSVLKQYAAVKNMACFYSVDMISNSYTNFLSYPMVFFLPLVHVSTDSIKLMMI